MSPTKYLIMFPNYSFNFSNYDPIYTKLWKKKKQF